MDMIYEDVDTPIGVFRVAERKGRLCAAGFRDKWGSVAARVEARFGDVAWAEGATGAGHAVRAYFAGDLVAMDELNVDAAGTTFQSAVWSQLRRIAPGSTLSYSALADAIGAPRASRAVGTANGANPICLVIPCHRVVRADGTTGGYGGGPARKAWLLDHEARHGRTA
jgi:methylated-DNA-[protein]-cysteine S-methyltransferase